MGCTICYALGGEWPPWHCPPSADCCENAIFQFIVMGDPVQSYACREARDFSYKWQPLGRPQISEHSGIHHPLACHPHHRQAPPSASRCEVGNAHPALTYPNTPRHGTSWKISLWALPFSWFPSILAHSQAIPAYVTEQPGKLQSPHAIRCHGTSSMEPPAIPSPPHVVPWRKEEFLPRDWRRHARTPLTSITTQDLVVTLFQL